MTTDNASSAVQEVDVAVEKSNLYIVKTTDQVNDNIRDILEKTADAGHIEKQMGVGEAIRRYPKEIFWSGIFAFGLIMAGYDAQIIGSLYGLDSFNNHFGDLQDDGTYAVSAAWQTAISMGTPIGQILIIIYAYPLEAFGRKRTYAFTAAGCIALVFMQFFASNLKVLCAGEILAGILWGGCVLIAPTYSSEISHNSIRAVLEAANNIGFVIGQFIGNGVMDAMSDRTDRYAYKIPFAVQWIWPTLILAFIYWAPESPYWLVRKGRIDDARAVLVQLAPKDEPVEAIEQRLILIQETDALERELEQTTSYKDIFRGTNSIRTEIASMVYVIQIFSGIPLCMNYSTFFFEKAGLADSDAFSLSLGSTAIGFVFTVLSWFLLSYFGRRVLYTGGLAIATVLLFLIGFLDVSPSYDTNDSLRWAQASFVLIWSAVWQCTVGPVMYVVIGEIPSTKLRGKTIAFATAMQSVTALVFSIIMPYILDENEGNLRGKAGFIFGGLSLISVAWCYLRLPETKGRTFDEIDIMFHRGVDLRKFSGYNIMSEPEDIMSTLDGEIIMKAVTSRDKA